MGARDKTRHRQRAIAALLTAPTIAEAAKTAGVSVSTLMRWQREPDFKAEIESVKRQYLASAVGELQQSATLAVRTLRRVLQMPHSSNLELIAASRAILDYCERYSVADSLNERITKLEQQRESSYGDSQSAGETGWQSGETSGAGWSTSFADSDSTGGSDSIESAPVDVRIESGNESGFTRGWSGSPSNGVETTQAQANATSKMPVLIG